MPWHSHFDFQLGCGDRRDRCPSRWTDAHREGCSRTYASGRDTDPHTTRWHVVCDHLHTHPSEALVRRIAERKGSEEYLGATGKSGILESIASRAALAHDLMHHAVFHSTPTHYPWLNLMEIWLSILARTSLKRGSFLSVDDVQTRELALIDASNRTMAKPFTETFQGKALMAANPA